MRSKILVASDGKPGALGALRTAWLLAEREGICVEVVTVFESTDLYAADSPHAIASQPPHYVPAAVEVLRSRVRAQLADLGSVAAEWPVIVEMGPVASSISRTAAKVGAGMILLGLRRPGPVERWLGRESLLRLIRRAPVPVLAVPEMVNELPKRVVLAVDFSESSRRAARQVLSMVAPGAELHLAHVTWIPTLETRNYGRHQSTEWEKSCRAGVELRLAEFAGQLEHPDGISVKTHLLAGEPESALLYLARRFDADLIAAGSRGTGFLGRILLGSVSAKLVHRAHCSLLFAPPCTVPVELGLEDLCERELLRALGTAGDLALSGSSPSA